MNLLKDLLPSAIKVTSRAKSRRAFLIEQFVVKLNSERGNYKPLSPKVVALKLAHLKEKDLTYFYSLCNQAKHFSRYFWWAIK